MKKLFLALMLLPQMAAAQLDLKDGWHATAEVSTASEQSYRMKLKDMNREFDMDLQAKLKTRLHAGYSKKLNDALTVGWDVNHDFYNFSAKTHGQSVLGDDSHHNFGASANALYRTQLWQKPFVVMGNLKIEASEYGLERFSGVGMGMIMLKATKEETLGVGVLTLINHTMQVPFIPFAMWRKQIDDRWTVNLNYPFYSMQYALDTEKRHTLMGGFTFDADHFWIKAPQNYDNRVLLFRRSLLKTGINYEYKINKNITLNAQTGWEYTMRAAIYSRHGGSEKATFNHPSGIYAMMNLKMNL